MQSLLTACLEKAGVSAPASLGVATLEYVCQLTAALVNDAVFLASEWSAATSPYLTAAGVAPATADDVAAALLTKCVREARGLAATEDDDTEVRTMTD